MYFFYYAMLIPCLVNLDVSTTRDECNEVEWRLTPLEGYDNLYILEMKI